MPDMQKFRIRSGWLKIIWRIFQIISASFSCCLLKSPQSSLLWLMIVVFNFLRFHPLLFGRLFEVMKRPGFVSSFIKSIWCQKDLGVLWKFLDFRRSSYYEGWMQECKAYLSWCSYKPREWTSQFLMFYKDMVVGKELLLYGLAFLRR